MYSFFVFHKGDIMLERRPDGTYTIPSGEDPPTEIQPHTNIINVTAPAFPNTKIRTYAIDSPVDTAPHYEMCPLRSSYYKLPYNMYVTAGKCRELLYWDESTRFCGVCGTRMKMHTEISKFRGNFYGLVAGFVETGETLEEAVQREVLEETGIRIKNIRYFSSQPWPYPCGLMVGFNAEYDSGDIRLQSTELSAGAWFGKDNLPEIPEKLSIARQLIDNFLLNLE